MPHRATLKTTLKTKFGLLEWLLIPFGITNAPATFPRQINDSFSPLLGQFVVIYLDEILVLSHSWDEHMQQLCHVIPLHNEHKLQVT